jgi:LDH2 family malate/lactate/ureidoglycolate dehydrogenase
MEGESLMEAAEKTYLMKEKDLVWLGANIFEKCGVPKEDAETLSLSLAEADMRGIKSHGMVRTAIYVDQFKNGKFAVDTKLNVMKETPVSLVLNGNNGVGAVVSAKAVELTRKKAEQSGMAFTAVRGSNHFGTCGYWAEMLAGDDMIGFASTNSIPIVSAPVGTGRAIGSNPFSYAIPSKKYAPICLDVSVGVMAQGKIYEYARLGKLLPENAWLGPDGKVTRDPNQWDPMDYVMIPFGMHKGFGLGIVMEMLTSGLSGAEFHREYQGLNAKTTENSHCFAAMKISAFSDADKFKEQVDKYIDYLHSLPVKNQGDKIYYPGEIEADLKAKHTQDGLPFSAKVLGDMLALAEEYGVDATYLIDKYRIQ